MSERPHPLTPLVKGWISLAVIIFWVGRDLLESGDATALFEGRMLIFLLVVGVFAGIQFGLGFFNWRFTHFLISDDEVRIDRTFISHTSNRIRFDRIQSVDVYQPFLARFFRLAGLRIEVGGTDSAKTIEFLKEDRARALRDYLLARAHGQRVQMDAIAAGASPGTVRAPLRAPQADPSEILVRVPVSRLVISAFTSSRFMNLVFFLGVLPQVIIRLNVADLAGLSWAGLVPFLLAVAGMLYNWIAGDGNFTLSRSGRGLRVSRGLTNLTSQSLPTDRIQAVSISQALLWRPLGLFRVNVTVLGYGLGSDDVTAPTTVLLPIADKAQVATALDAVWPGFTLNAIGLQPLPTRARWVRPFGFPFVRWGLGNHAIVSRAGLWTQITSIVPHARAQSITLTQGPLQRQLRLASLRVDVTTGPVALTIAGLDAADARALALSELDRSRAARVAEDHREWLDVLPAPSTQAPVRTPTATELYSARRAADIVPATSPLVPERSV